MERPDVKLLLGNEACCLGALRGGCTFYAGYPITPSTEIMEFMAAELPKRGGKFLQMEDEIASIGSVIGAAWAGAKAMTATSGPGLSLMMENIGYAAMTETPCVLVDIQRAGPCTGQATRTGSGDVMQARFGSHGDYEVIALSPWSVQEMYDLTVHAFNLAEKYRNPVFLMADESVGHLREKVVLHKNTPILERAAKSDSAPFGDPATNEPTPMPAFGQGRALLVTGSTHDHFGYRRTSESVAQRLLVERIVNKIRRDRERLARLESYHLPGAEVAVVSYGFTARAALDAVKKARETGVNAGLLRLITLWPFPTQVIQSALSECARVVVFEMNQGQMSREIERTIRRDVEMIPKTTGDPFTPDEILEVICS